MADNKISITVDLDSKQAQKGIAGMTAALQTFGTEGKNLAKTMPALAAGTDKSAASLKEFAKSSTSATTALNKFGQTEKVVTSTTESLRGMNAEVRAAATVLPRMANGGTAAAQALRDVSAASRQTVSALGRIDKAGDAVGSLGRYSRNAGTAMRGFETRVQNAGAVVSNLRKEMTGIVGVTNTMTAAVNTTGSAIAKVGNQVNRLTNQWNTQRAAMQRSQQASQGLANSFRALRGLDFTFQGAVLGGGALMAAQNILETAASVDKLKLSIQSLAPAGTNVTALFAQLQELSEKPGGDIEAVFGGVAALLPGFDYKTQAVVKTISEFQNALALTGKGGQELTLVLNQLAQAAGKGKVAMEDFRYIFQQIPQARAILAAKYGTADLEELTKKGLGFFDVILTLVEGLQNLDRAQEGIAVSMQKVRNQIRLLTADIGDLIAKQIDWKQAVDSLKDARKALEDMPPWLKDVGVKAGLAAAAIFLLAGAITLVATVVGGLGTLKIAAWIVGIGLAVKTLKDDLEDLWVVLKAVVPWITSAKGKGTTFEDVAVKEYDTFKDTAKRARQDISGTWKHAPKAPKELLPKELSMTPQELKAYQELEELRKKHGAVASEKGKKADPYAAFLEQAQRVRDAAIAKEEGGLGGLEERYAKHFRTVEKLWESAKKSKKWATNMGMIQEGWNALQVAMASDLRKEQKKLADAQRDQMKQYLETVDETARRANEIMADRFKERLAWQAQTMEMERENIRQSVEMQIERVSIEADQARARAASLPKDTMNQRIFAEKAMASIEIQEAQKVHEYKLLLLQEEFDYRESMAIAESKNADDLADRMWALKQARDLANARLKASTDATIAKRELDAMAQIQDAIRDNYRKTYEHIKDSAGRVFDALLDKSTSFFDAFANMFKTAVLTAMKEVVSSQIARIFTRLVVSGQQAGGTGAPGSPGATPPFIPAGGGGGGWSRAGDVIKNVWSRGVDLLSRGGGSQSSRQSDFFPVGPSSYTSGMGSTGPIISSLPTIIASSKVNPYAQMAALGGAAMGAQGIGRGGPLGAAQGIGGFALSGAMLGKLGIPALTKFGGWTGAGIGAGVGLMAAGAKAQNPVARWGMTVGGGLLAGGLLGAKIGAIGGPMGMAIGAAVGAGIAIIASLRKTAEQKVREEVKRVYGVDISSKGILTQIAGIAKNTYGGDIRLAVASPQVQELVRLYSMTTGQSQAGLPRQMHAATFAQQGGSMSLQPVYSGGTQVASPYVGTTTSQYAAGVQIVPVDTGNIMNLIAGQTVTPANVSAANSAAIQNGTGRQAQATGMLEPLTAVR